MAEATTAHALRRALARAGAGKALSVDEIEALLGARGPDLRRLMSLASHLRELGHGSTVTYSRKVFVPLTMLCRDHCHYCTFAKPPARLERPFLSPEEVVAIAEAGRRLGCKEALFTLGDRPEERYPVARAWLAERGYSSTLEYVRAAAIRVIEETGLLPHLNPGVMSYEEMARLKQVAPSMGMMLETSSDRLAERGGPHFGSPDKVPAVRLRVIEDAGRLAIPFTTGILVGIGETLAERADSLLAIRELHRRYRHIQEVIVQNFRAKPRIPMRDAAEPSLEDLLWTLAVARLVLGPDVNIQAPPNLSPDVYPRLLAAGLNDWGGISPLTLDHINPEKPWPLIPELRRATESQGFVLRERLAIYPEFATRAEYLDESLRARVQAQVDERGLVKEAHERWRRW
jgi:FO synthase